MRPAPIGVDVHNHLDAPEFDGDRAEVVRRARAQGVVQMLLSGGEPARWARVAAVAAELGASLALGLHPWVAPGVDEAGLAAALAGLAGWPMQALGECGLDALHAKNNVSRARQRAALSAQLGLARTRGLPVVLHCVRAYPELLVLLKREGVPAAGGFVHGWSGPPEMIAEVVGLGLCVSVGGPALNPRNAKLHASVRALPLDGLLLESDAPAMPRPGVLRSEPADLWLIAEGLAALRSEPVERIWEAAAVNARRVLGLSGGSDE